MKNKVVLLLTTFLLLVGCNTKKPSNNPSSNASSSSGNPSSSESSSSSSSSSEPGPTDILVDSINLSRNHIHLNPGQSVKLNATVLPSNATDQRIEWVIEDSNVISYSEGNVHAEALGTSTIYATTVSTEQQSTSYTYEICNVTVDNEVSPTYDYEGYYYGLSWTNSEDLISQLHDIISDGYNPVKYEGNWATNQGADQALDDFEMVDLIYSDDKDLKTNTYSNGKGWQREHAFAASLMTGFTSGDAVGTGKGRATDFHNLFAASYSGNTSRGNKNFGIANTEDPTYLNPGPYSSDSKNFEPSNTDKGRLSRAVFYMAVMYNETEEETVKVTLKYSDEDAATYGKASTTVSIPVTYQPLRVVEDYVSYDKFTYTNWYYHNTKPDTWENEKYEALQAAVTAYGEGEAGYAQYSMENCQFAIGNLSTLLTWASSDIDYLEMQHNMYVYGNSGQGNRNPFVDYPALVDYCFGSKKNQSGSLADLTASYTNLNMDTDSINRYAIQTAKREYDEGSTFKVGDYSIKAVKNDFTLTNPSYSDTTPSYVFTPADAAAGKKRLTITTPINSINLDVTVNAGALDSCSYKGLVVNIPKGNFVNGQATNVDGVNWTPTWTNETGTMGNKDSTYGLGFGVAAGGKTMHELTLATVSSYTVNKVYFKGSCKAGETIDVTIKVGSDTVYSGSITRTSGMTTAPEVVGASFENKTGTISIIINGSGATNGAIYVHTLAFNVVS